MSWWSSATHPLNNIFNSDYFKVAFPVNALANGAVKGVTGLAGLNHGQGLEPTDQYAIGAGVGSGLGGGSALFGGGASGTGMVPYMPTSAPNMGAAGSTLGAGGGSSPLSLGGYGSTGSMGLGGDTATGASPVMKALQAMRGQGMQQGQKAGPSQQEIMAKFYRMFPSLVPGAGLGQGMNTGGL